MIPFFAEQWNIETAFSFFCLSLCPWRDLFFLELMNNLKCYKGYIVLIEDRKLWKKEKKYRSPKLLLVLYIDYKFLNFGGTLLPSSNKQWNCFWQFRYPKPCQLDQLLFAGKLAYRLKNEGAKVRLYYLSVTLVHDLDLQLFVGQQEVPFSWSFNWCRNLDS